MAEEFMRIEFDALKKLSELARSAVDESIPDSEFRLAAREVFSDVRLHLDSVDFTIEWEDVNAPFGPSVYLVRPHTDGAREWLTARVPEDAQWLGGALAVEHRFIQEIHDGIVEAGMRVATVRT